MPLRGGKACKSCGRGKREEEEGQDLTKGEVGVGGVTSEREDFEGDRREGANIS